MNLSYEEFYEINQENDINFTRAHVQKQAYSLVSFLNRENDELSRWVNLDLANDL